LQGFGTRRTRVIVERWGTVVKCMETSTSAAILYVFYVYGSVHHNIFYEITK
jgi:hypothetical protein